jgi:ADP-dependent NAD(P)H-hydrate dehydratase / NAD(P)H-hydrate epimerase
LYALGDDDGIALLAARTAPTILTPHDGEFARLHGTKPTSCRHDDARALARKTNSVVLLKGSTTVIAAPDDTVLFATQGGPQLATAGTGDVLSGVIGAFVARDVDAQWAAAAGAYVHGAASRRGYRDGLVSTDLPELVASWMSSVQPVPRALLDGVDEA